MPTIHRHDAFEYRVYLNDHPPPHVHSFKDGVEAEINLGDDSTVPSLRKYWGMSAKDARRAVEIAAEQQEKLLADWERYHG